MKVFPTKVLLFFFALSYISYTRFPQQTVIVSRLPPARTDADHAKYIVSPLEAEWLASSRVHTICEMARSQAAQSNIWSAYSKSVLNPAKKPLAPMNEAQKGVMSEIWTNGRMQQIEPLCGTGRHPHFDICKVFGFPGAGPFDISYLIPMNECTGDGPRFPDQRKVLFDLGCTTFGNGKTTTEKASASGPSMPLFINMYDERCIHFNEVFGWEGKQYKAADWWREVPTEWRRKVHFYNTYVIEETLEATRAGDFKVETNKASFLKMLPLSVKEEDLVVLKIDIDGGPELQIVETIANRPDLSILIDELYFEYHYYYDGMNFGWGHAGNENTSNVDHAIALFEQLRKAGIRAHFWV